MMAVNAQITGNKLLPRPAVSTFCDARDYLHACVNIPPRHSAAAHV